MTRTNLLDEAQLIATEGRCDLTQGELRTLSSLLHICHRRRQPARYLEIGVFGGGTTKWLREQVPGLVTVGVDLFEDLHVISNTHISGNYTKDMVQKFLGPDAQLIKGDSQQVLPMLRGHQFDVIFIDGNHTYEATKSDFLASIPLLAPGGFMAFHNASPDLYPDYEYYNQVDGGPWQISLELQMHDPRWQMIEQVDRLRVFADRSGFFSP